MGDGHALYLEQSGNPDGMPVVFLHGGPGSGCQPGHRSLFDGRRHRVILFDQRGCGRSTPKSSLVANTTQHLVADLERIREALGIERWLVVGGSWGSLLALAYALEHPKRVTGLALRALFLGSAAEVDWAFRAGPRAFRPELYEAFLKPLPLSEREDPIAAYGRRLDSEDEKLRLGAARIWHDYEQALSVLQPKDTSLPESFEAAARAGGPGPNTPGFEWHYIKHGFFLGPGETILDRSPELGCLPGVIVQGRYDLLCPPRTAHRLAERWPGGRLMMAEAAGHSVSEPSVRQAVAWSVSELSGLR